MFAIGMNFGSMGSDNATVSLPVYYRPPVNPDGVLLELILSTDYLAENDRALEWLFAEIPGITESAVGYLGIQSPDDSEVYLNSSGVVTDEGSGIFKVSFDITNTDLELTPGEYDWSVEVREGGNKITVARNRQIKTRVKIVEHET